MVELRELTYDDAHAHAKQYVTALTESEGQEREHVVGVTLDWLWQVIASPVLNALDHREQAATESGEKTWPRLWWCPTGPLATLPLHAAWHSQEDSAGAAVLDRIISSYTPTLLVLVRARQKRDTGQATSDGNDRRLLHVTIGDSPGQESPPD